MKMYAMINGIAWIGWVVGCNYKIYIDCDRELHK